MIFYFPRHLASFRSVPLVYNEVHKRRTIEKPVLMATNDVGIYCGEISASKDANLPNIDDKSVLFLMVDLHHSEFNNIYIYKDQIVNYSCPLHKSPDRHYRSLVKSVRVP